jgi:hypothetical protein
MPPDITALGARAALDAPHLHRVVDIRADIGPPTEFPTTQGFGRSLFPILGGIAQGDGWRAVILPGGADFARLLPDGTYEVEVRYLLRLDDGTMMMVTNAGRMVPQPDGSYLGRTHARLEVPPGPQAALGEMVLVGTALAPADDPDHVYVELWHAPI